MQVITVSARTGAVIVRAAAAMGVSPGALRDLTGFDAASAADPDARISLELEAQLWDAAARISGDPLFGLHAAELLEPGAFDVLEYAARTAPTLREALGRLARYNRIEHDAAVFSLTHGLVVIGTNATNTGSGEEMIAGVDWLVQQHASADSLYFEKLDLGAIATVGYSQGGIGAP